MLWYPPAAAPVATKIPPPARAADWCAPTIITADTTGHLVARPPPPLPRGVWVLSECRPDGTLTAPAQRAILTALGRH